MGAHYGCNLSDPNQIPTVEARGVNRFTRMGFVGYGVFWLRCAYKTRHIGDGSHANLSFISGVSSIVYLAMAITSLALV
jgi:hypothetical protein